MGSGSTPGGM